MPQPRELPLLKVAIAFILGISLQEIFQFPMTFLIIGLSLTSCFSIIFHFVKSISTTHKLRALLLYACISLLGSFIFQSKVGSLSHEYLEDHMYSDVGAILKCTTTPKSKKLTQFEATITHLNLSDSSYHAIRPVKVLVHLFEPETDIKIGDVFHINEVIKVTSKSQSPMAFDYSKYLKFRGVAYQTYLSSDDIKVIKRTDAPWSESVRAWGISQFQKYLSEENIAIASALVLGYRGFIDDELYHAFAETGSMHVLAVSGLHVGIVSMFLSFILSVYRHNGKWVKVMKSIFLLMGIWSFAFVSGASPSVMRASLMFSFFLVSKIICGHYNVYNSLGASAFILLIMNPLQLFHIGFQLSFTAILSIIIFCSKISSWYSSKYWIVQKIWELISVALSVQILTLPVSLYYFQQFPTYFILTGVTAVISAIGIMWTAIVTIILSYFSHAEWIWQPLDLMISFLNLSTHWIHSWPWGLVKNISFDIISLILAFLVITAFSTFFFLRRKWSLSIALSICCLLAIKREAFIIMNHDKNEIVIYDTRSPLIDVFIDGKVYSYADEKLTKKNIEFASKKYRTHKQVNEVIVLKTEEQFLTFIELNEEVLKKISSSSKFDYSRTEHEFFGKLYAAIHGITKHTT